MTLEFLICDKVSYYLQLIIGENDNINIPKESLNSEKIRQVPLNILKLYQFNLSTLF